MSKAISPNPRIETWWFVLHPIITWSSIGIPIIFPVSIRRLVSIKSSSLGVASPLGCVWTTIIEAAHNLMAWQNISRGSIWVAFKFPLKTRIGSQRGRLCVSRQITKVFSCFSSTPTDNTTNIVRPQLISIEKQK